MSAPDLVAESGEREAHAEWSFDSEMILRTPHSLPAAGAKFRLVHYGELPEPYGPDPVVFGPGAAR